MALDPLTAAMLLQNPQGVQNALLQLAIRQRLQGALGSGAQTANPLMVTVRPAPAATAPAASTTPAWMHALAGPNMQVTNAPTGATVQAPSLLLPSWLTPAAAATAAPMNQANPAITANAQPGAAGEPSGPVPAGAPTPTPSNLAAQAAAYRAATGGGALTTDQLNAQSLAAAQAGRTYLNPNVVLQPGQNVTNMLTLPPTVQS